MSFWLEVRKHGSGETKLEKKLPDPPSGRVGPYKLRHWAEREGLEIEYIDNCHVQVPVDRERLQVFLTELYSPHDPLLLLFCPFSPLNGNSFSKPNNSDPDACFAPKAASPLLSFRLLGDNTNTARKEFVMKFLPGTAFS